MSDRHDAIAAALATIEKLREALRKYGRHRLCDLVGMCDHEPACCAGEAGACTCGLDAALQPAEGEGETSLLDLALECWSNGRKWAELGHLEPLHEQEASCRREVAAFLASIPSPSLAPLREHEREIARRAVTALARRLDENAAKRRLPPRNQELYASDVAWALEGVANRMRQIAASGPMLAAFLLPQEPAPAPPEGEECGTGKAGKGEGP